MNDESECMRQEVLVDSVKLMERCSLEVTNEGHGDGLVGRYSTKYTPKACRSAYLRLQTYWLFVYWFNGDFLSPQFQRVQTVADDKESAPKTQRTNERSETTVCSRDSVALKFQGSR
jgi:hypothetical protein